METLSARMVPVQSDKTYVVVKTFGILVLSSLLIVAFSLFEKAMGQEVVGTLVPNQELVFGLMLIGTFLIFGIWNGMRIAIVYAVFLVARSVVLMVQQDVLASAYGEAILPLVFSVIGSAFILAVPVAAGMVLYAIADLARPFLHLPKQKTLSYVAIVTIGILIIVATGLISWFIAPNL